MLRPFEIHQPAPVADAGRRRAQCGDDSAVYAGGTELLPVVKEGLLCDTYLIDLKAADGLTEIRVDADTGEIWLAALATHSATEHSSVVDAHFPRLAEVERTVANLPL